MMEGHVTFLITSHVMFWVIQVFLSHVSNNDNELQQMESLENQSRRIIIERESLPVNEFSNNNLLLMQGFSCKFILG